METKAIKAASVFSQDDSLPALLARNGIETHFHPVASVRRECVVGVEALSRGVSLSGTLIAPLVLFDEAARLGLACELDRACQRAAFAAFAPLHRADNALMLFVNLHAECIPDALSADVGLIALTREFDVAPRFVVVEILETALEDTSDMRGAIDAYRNHGFLVALDDVGAGHSSLNRILSIRPDILKTDRSLIENIENDFYKQQIYKAVLQMGEKLGGWVVTEGVEKQAETLVAMGLGADLFQGFYFSKPHKLNVAGAGEAQTSARDLQEDVGRVRDTASRFKRQTIRKIKQERTERSERRKISHEVAVSIQARLNDAPRPASGSDPTLLETILTEAITPFTQIESASLFDETGTQITDTVLHPYPLDPRKTVMYPPPARGTNHASKEYFYLLMETRLDRYETKPYVPLPSGDICITVSARANWDDVPLIICLHLFVTHSDPSPSSVTPLE